MNFRTALLISLFVLAVFPASATNTFCQEPVTGHSQLRPCSIKGIEEKMLCGEFEVFENRIVRSGRKIKLKIIVIPASNASSNETPLFYLDGGPGLAATQNTRFFAVDVTNYRRDRDIVLVDQRGTGGSNALSCSPTSSSPQYFLDEMYPVEYVKKCRSELEKKADLTQYTTEIAMDDLDDIRIWLGYSKINIWGLSYGTRAAQIYMRRHPGSVRSVVLSGALPTDHKMPMYHARDGQRALDLLLDSCLANQSCNSAFPNIKQELRTLIRNLRQSPAKVKYTQPKSNAKYHLRITADVFAEFLRKRLYSPASSRKVPLIIHQASLGDFVPFLNAIIPQDNGIHDDDSDGLYLSVTCAEDVPFISAASALKQSENTIFDSYRLIQQKRACGLWKRGKVSAGFRSPVVSNIPTLILSGNFDPITPPELGMKIAAHLSQSRQIVIATNAHIEDGLSNLECLDNLILTFINSADIHKLDASCLDKMTPQPFVVKK
ncbi:MAG: alpha/beta fold hydrolase [Pyrinomonadaceae bacterium]